MPRLGAGQLGAAVGHNSGAGANVETSVRPRLLQHPKSEAPTIHRGVSPRESHRVARAVSSLKCSTSLRVRCCHGNANFAHATAA